MNAKARFLEPGLLVYLPPMHWIEELLRLDPDAGSGATEMFIAGALVLGLVALAYRVVSHRRA